MARKKQEVAAESEEQVVETSGSEEQAEATDKKKVAVKKHSRLDSILGSDTLKAITKRHGVSIIRKATEHHSAQSQFIPTGSLNMDYTLGGGFRVGGIHTVWGPKSSGKTSTLLMVIGQAQQMCGNCWQYATFADSKTGEVLSTPKCPCGKFREVIVGYINNEGTWDQKWAIDLGVNPETLLLSEPEYAEQTLDIAEALIRDGNIDILAIDSIAFMTPEKEIEESASKETMGVQPRVLGKGIRKFVAALNHMGNKVDRKPTVFFTNQVRMKLGVMFGCFHEDTPVMFADGTQVPIREVVEKELQGPVLSWDGEKVVERRIVNWFNNGELGPEEQWLTFRTEGTHGSRGATGFTCTPNHVLVTGEGEEVRAGEFRVGDTLTSWYEATLSASQREIVTGSLLGDGTITPQGSLGLANSEQPGYLKWKLDNLQSLGFRQVTSCERTTWRSVNSFELRLLRKLFYGSDQVRESKGYRTIPLDLLKAAGPLTYAVWYCDDGSYKESHRSASISVKRLTDDHAVAVAAVVAERYPGVTYSSTQRAVVFPTETFRQFSKDIQRYVPESMAYKLLPEHRPEAGTAALEAPDRSRRVCHPVKVTSIHVSERKHRSRTKYDLQIEGNSFYLVGGDSSGVVVHNSPETQPGGMAPQFAATTEIKFKSAKYEIDKDKGDKEAADIDLSIVKPASVLFSFKVEKNKQGQAPMMEGAYRLTTVSTETKPKGTVMDEVVLIEQAERYEIIKKEGSKWTCAGVPFDTKKALQTTLETDATFKRLLSKRILECLLAD